MDAAQHNLSILHTLTRHQPPAWNGRRRRVDIDLMRDAFDTLNKLDPKTHGETASYICGPSDFVENVANYAVEIGIKPQNIRTERFGPTGT